MKVIMLVFTAGLLLHGKQLADVDLTLKHLAGAGKPGSVCIVGGGVYDGPRKTNPAPETPPVTVRLISIEPGTMVGDYYRSVVSVEVANSGTSSYAVPVGTDLNLFSGSGQQDRREFRFTVTVQHRIVGSGQVSSVAASSAARAESFVVLKPGDTVIYRLPFAIPATLPNETAPPTIDVALQAIRHVLVGGQDCRTSSGDQIVSQNSIPLAGVAASH